MRTKRLGAGVVGVLLVALGGCSAEGYSANGGARGGDLGALLVGTWRADPPANEVLELAADGALVTTAGDVTYAGRYRLAGDTLEYALDLHGRIRRAKMKVVSVSRGELVLRGELTGQNTTYRRVGGH